MSLSLSLPLFIFSFLVYPALFLHFVFIFIIRFVSRSFHSSLILLCCFYCCGLILYCIRFSHLRNLYHSIFFCFSRHFPSLLLYYSLVFRVVVAHLFYPLFFISFEIFHLSLSFTLLERRRTCSATFPRQKKKKIYGRATHISFTPAVLFPILPPSPRAKQRHPRPAEFGAMRSIN